MEEITKLKAEVFDIVVQIEQLVALKQRKLAELQKLLQEQNKDKIDTSN
jgi:hypothetical protein